MPSFLKKILSRTDLGWRTNYITHSYFYLVVVKASIFFVVHNKKYTILKIFLKVIDAFLTFNRFRKNTQFMKKNYLIDED